MHADVALVSASRFSHLMRPPAKKRLVSPRGNAKNVSVVRKTDYAPVGRTKVCAARAKIRTGNAGTRFAPHAVTKARPGLLPEFWMNLESRSRMLFSLPQEMREDMCKSAPLARAPHIPPGYGVAFSPQCVYPPRV